MWVDKEAICNLLALCDLVKRGHRVKYDSAIGDWFDVISKNGVWMRFVANERGLYIKEKMEVIRNRMKEMRAKGIKKLTNTKAHVNNKTFEGSPRER